MNEESEYFEYEFDELKKRAEYVFAQIVDGSSPIMDDEEFEEVIEFFIECDEAEKSLRICEIALLQYPFNAALVVLKADAYLELDLIDEAEELIENTPFLDYSDVNTYLIKSDIALYRDDTTKALSFLDEALNHCQDDLESVFLQYADIYEEMESFEELFISLMDAIKCNIENEESFQRLWITADIIEAHEQSLTFHKEIVDENPYCVHAWYNISHAYTSLKRTEEAIDALEFVIAIDETYNVAYLDIAELHIKKKNYKKALEYYLEAEIYFKHYKDVFFHIGLCYEMLNEMNKSRNYYRKAITLDPQCYETNYRIGRTYFKEDKISSAINYFEKANKLNIDSIRVLQALALTYNKNEDVLKAITIYQRMLELDPENCFIWINLAINYFSAKERKFALELLDNASIKFNDNAEIQYTKFLLLYEIGQKKTALSALAKGLELDFELKQLVFDINPDLLNDTTVMNLVELYQNEE